MPLFTWKMALEVAAYTIGGFAILLLMTITLMKVVNMVAPPSPHITCAVHYTFSEYTTHSTEWQIRADEKCGVIYLDSGK